MGKPKKGKKGRQDDDFGDDDVDLDPLAQPPAEEEVEVAKPAGGKKGKKGKKKKDDDWEDDVASELAALSMEANKDAPEDDVANGEVEEFKPKKKEKKKKKKAQKEEDEDEEEENDTDIVVQASGKTGNKAMSAFQMLDIEGSEDEDEEEEKEEEAKPAKINNKNKANKKQLSLEESETTEEGAEDMSQTAPKQQGKKSKKGKKETKKAAEEEDIDALLAEIEKPAEKTGKKGKKKKQTGAEMEVEPSTATAETPGGTAEVEGASADTTDKELATVTPEDLELEFQDEDKPTKKTKVEKEASVEEEEDGEHTVKTAAQKKKEKKERQKQQKLLEKQKGKKKKDVEKEGTPEDETAEATVQPVSETTEGATDTVEGAEAQALEDEGEDGDQKKKKDKRKKKKDKDKDKEEEKAKKKPAKGQIKAMQEALMKIKEEEERMQREEEEKLQRLEQARIEKEEQERLEKERKEKKKQKDKERIQKLKAEGKYLTPKQKEAQKRAQQMLEAMKAQGLEIPTKEEGEPQKKKRVVYEKKKKRPPQQQATEQVQVTPSPTEEEKKIEIEETPSEQEEKVEVKEEPKPEKIEEDDAKEAWDISDDEEETDVTDSKTDAETKTEEKKAEAKPEETEDAEEEEEDDDDEEEESEEDSDSDDDTDSEDSEEDSESEEESEDEGITDAERKREKAIARIKKRKEDAEARRTTDVLRAPVVCVMGHVDTGKTKILDKLRRTNVQDGEAGGITQQIGATNVPVEAIRDQTKMCKEFTKQELKVPGLLIIDTPGHESFSNLRSRGSSLCDIAILVVDIMHGLEPQTIESINLLKQKKTPFIVALNKIDRLFQWRSNPHSDIANNLKKQQMNTKQEFDERVQEIIVQFAEQGLNAALFYENKNTREYLSMVPTSAHSGDGMGNLIALICDLTQNLLAKRLAYSDELQATTMEVKALPGLGTTVDVILVNGRLKEMDTVILAGTDGPIVTQLRGVLTPQPMRELRVKANYIHHKEVPAAQGVKLIAKDLEKALAGMPLYVAEEPDEIEIYKEEIANVLKEALSSIKTQERGVFVQASTLGSLEALLEFLRTSKIPYAGINIGPVHKKDVMKASIMLEHDSQYATILAFDVKIEREAQELADSLGVKIFHADIIYHLFDKFIAYREEIKAKKREEFKYIAVFPCKIRIMPQYVFNSRDPIVVGVMIEGGFVKEGTPLCVPTKEFVDIGRVVGIENNHKAVDQAHKGQEVCLKIDPVPGEAPKMYGRHFDHDDMLVSKISRQSIDAVKNYFRDDMTKADWQLIMELKKTFEIL